jgi:uncharacterized Zn finger protein
VAWYGEWKPYVPVAQRRANALRHAAAVAKKQKRPLAPIKIDGKKIAASFWGQAWCEHLERYSDFANRLPRGRTYVRNGSVVDLQIERGKIKALVAGSDVYTVKIAIETLGKTLWTRIKRDCAQSIDSLIDLLQGRFDQGIMQRLTHRESGLFPQPAEIEMDCSCPDWAGMCKHVAAVLYGVGARLDTAPELLFTLRAVDHLELIGQAVAAENLNRTLGDGQNDALAGSDLGELFGIEIDAGAVTQKVMGRQTGRAKAGMKKIHAQRKPAAATTMRAEAPSKASRKAAVSLGKRAIRKTASAKPAAKSQTGGSRARTIEKAKRKVE